GAPGTAAPAAPTAASIPHALLLLATFRSSGRFFWIVYYAALLFSLAIVLRRLAPRHALIVVAGVTLLQLIDSNPLRERLATLTRHATPPVLDWASWKERISAAKLVVVEPSMMCGGDQLGIPNIELQL